ncbi:hypothetical protein PISMIDRAFT_317516 [Pisolithus microcarpus 441]|uniref:Unplaced genomic scaffold scaffold_20, whole genome shotgun sequence n=1 Tax=Pisolithus microcarpus 441 TaxID=765257 RepID=A0A0C9YM53_9AGAM|nr:hypothetical protein PISMIDRAFT_317516 [Pisolithus microcarpus 441]
MVASLFIDGTGIGPQPIVGYKWLWIDTCQIPGRAPNPHKPTSGARPVHNCGRYAEKRGKACEKTPIIYPMLQSLQTTLGTLDPKQRHSRCGQRQNMPAYVVCESQELQLRTGKPNNNK